MASFFRALTVVALAALTLTLAGCASSTDGPLETTGVTSDPELDPTSYSVCQNLGSHDAITFGEEVANTSDLPIAITDIELVENDGLRVIEMFSIPGPNGIVGTDAYPMDNVLPETWEARVPALGLIVQPGEVSHILIGAALDAGRDYGTAHHLEISYTFSGAEHTALTGGTFSVALDCDEMPEAE